MLTRGDALRSAQRLPLAFILRAFGAGTHFEPWRWQTESTFDRTSMQLNIKRDRARELSVDVERDAMRARIEQSSERQNELRRVCIFTSLVSGAVEDRAHVAAI
jgi:hypothetical protein